MTPMTSPAPVSPPALGLHVVLRLLVGLRFRLAGRRLAPRGAWLGAAFASIVALSVAAAAAYGSQRLFAGLLARGGPLWLDFGLALFCLGLERTRIRNHAATFST